MSSGPASPAFEADQDHAVNQYEIQQQNDRRPDKPELLRDFHENRVGIRVRHASGLDRRPLHVPFAHHAAGSDGKFGVFRMVRGFGRRFVGNEPRVDPFRPMFPPDVFQEFFDIVMKVNIRENPADGDRSQNNEAKKACRNLILPTHSSPSKMST